jgi:hypothetical protein
LTQLQGKRKAEWDHTAMIVLAVQRSGGNKNAQFKNPYAVDNNSAAEFKKFMKGQRK